MKKLTPAQKQYLDLKQKYKDCILFFRMGDFYETFYEDAKICSKVLDIALTTRDKNSANPIPMAGVPYHSADKYIQKLVESGYKVAIAEQIGPVKPWQIVERDVVAVITPWTFLEDERLKDYNFIVAISVVDSNWEKSSDIFGKKSSDISFSIAFWDFSLGEYWTKTFDNKEELLKFISKIAPKEVILDLDIPADLRNEIAQHIKQFVGSFISIYSKPDFPEEFIKNVLKISKLDSFWDALNENTIWVFSMLLSYLLETQKSSLANIVKISRWSEENEVRLDDITIKNLEIFQSSYEGSKKYSLFWVLDEAITPLGSRYLKKMLLKPTRDLKILKQRFSDIAYIVKIDDIEDLKIKLKNIWDIQRLVSKIIYKKNLPSLWLRLKNYIQAILDIASDNRYQVFVKPSEKVYDLFNKVNKFLKEEITSDEIDFIKDGVNEKIDELRKIAYHSDELLLEYQKELQQTFWLQARIKYITNQWYFIEFTKKDAEVYEKIKSKFSDLDEKKFWLVRRQTLKSVERYVSPYLLDIQDKIVNATEQLKELEKQILENLKTELEQSIKDFFVLADQIWYLDVLGIAWDLIKNKNWTIPEVYDGFDIYIKSGRHPVIEKFLPSYEEFVPNDLVLTEQDYIHIITWPNMWWKSTYLRQNALIVLLAHCGLPVPAQEAKIWLVDGIYARVGSWDVLAKNQSTFMTEMIEVSSILHNATKNSFVILDELGRWTSTYDGMALAKAILKFIAENIQCKTLFATHYHELIELEWKIKGVSNWSVAVYETENEVVFLKKIVRGGASKSYGIEVARLAWLPSAIIEEAQKYLQEFETKSKAEKSSPMQLGLFGLIWWEDTQKLKLDIEKLKQENKKLREILQDIKKILDRLE